MIRTRGFRGWFIAKFLQNAFFGLSLFMMAASKKVRSRACYSSLFSKRPSQKSSRLKPNLLKELGYIILLMTNVIAFAKENTNVISSQYNPVDAVRATWVFSGIATSEAGENFGYFFQLQRNENHFHVVAALVDETSKKVLLHEESEADIQEGLPYNWHVGRAFLKFNAINHSWIFGVKSKENLGFNFKVDMMKQFLHAPTVHHLRSDVVMIVSQTSELNGHVAIGDAKPERFVTADDAWYRQIWQSGNNEKQHPLTGILCRFNEGGGFYSVNLNEPDAQSGAIAAWYTETGSRRPMSQFIQVSPSNNGDWNIQLQAPRMNLVIADTGVSPSIIAGFIEGDKNKGFCMLSKSTLAAPQPSQTVSRLG